MDLTNDDNEQYYNLSTTLSIHDKPIRGAVILDDDSLLTMQTNGIFRLYERESKDSRIFEHNKTIQKIHEENKLLFCINKSPDNQYIWSGGADNIARSWTINGDIGPTLKNDTNSAVGSIFI